MTKGEVLFDPVNVRRCQGRRLSQGAAAFSTLALEQMALARTSEKDFPGGGYFEPFADGFPGLNSFGSSHRIEWGWSGMKRLRASLSRRLKEPL